MYLFYPVYFKCCTFKGSFSFSHPFFKFKKSMNFLRQKVFPTCNLCFVGFYFATCILLDFASRDLRFVGFLVLRLAFCWIFGLATCVLLDFRSRDSRFVRFLVLRLAFWVPRLAFCWIFSLATCVFLHFGSRDLRFVKFRFCDLRLIEFI